MEWTATSVDAALARCVSNLDPLRTKLVFWRQDELIVLPSLLPPALVHAVTAEVEALEPAIVRKHVPGYKQAGSIGYFTLRERAPTAVALYRSSVLRRFLADLADRELLTCPEDDAHACAAYCYGRGGDRIGFHYDTSWYRGARYTVLLGLVDGSSARLHCQVHSRERHRPTVDLRVQTTPGTLVVFNGDKLRHAVTPLRPGERRVVLALQYVTDRHMDGWRRMVSRVKDSLTYFGAERKRPVANGRPAQDPSQDPGCRISGR